MTNRGILKRASEELEKGNEFAIATIIDAKGSTPRETGTKMLFLLMERHMALLVEELLKNELQICVLKLLIRKKSYIHLPLGSKGWI